MSDSILSTVDDGYLNSNPNIQPYDSPSADQWNAWFGNKVDADSGYLTNPTVIGDLVLGNQPTLDMHAAPKSYIDALVASSGAGIPDAPTDGAYYCRVNSSWAPAPTSLPSAPINGDMTIYGALTVSGAGSFASGITSGAINSNAGTSQFVNLAVVGNVGFYNTAPIAKPTVTGAWAGNAAGKALCVVLASFGLIIDGTTA